MKSYDVTIQMKPLCLFFNMVLFVCQNFKKTKFGKLVEICLWPHLTVKGFTPKRDHINYFPTISIHNQEESLKNSIGNHLRDSHNQKNKDLTEQFTILKKCRADKTIGRLVEGLKQHKLLD